MRRTLAATLVLAACALAVSSGAAARPRQRIPLATVGCADGEREAFRDLAHYPRIAGCSGAWSRPGVGQNAPPACDRKGGDDGVHPDGRGCATADMCAQEWHVCRDVADVARSSPDGCGGASDAPRASFYATRQSGPGCAECATGTRNDCGDDSCGNDCGPSNRMTNDLFGCGTLGTQPHPSCGVLDRFSNNMCFDLGAPWRCDDDVDEANVVVKRGSRGGGVLCCRD